ARSAAPENLPGSGNERHQNDHSVPGSSCRGRGGMPSQICSCEWTDDGSTQTLAPREVHREVHELFPEMAAAELSRHFGMEDRERVVRLLVRKKRRLPLDGQLKTAACTIVRNNGLLGGRRFARPNADLDGIGRRIARWKRLGQRLIELLVIMLGLCVCH